MSSSDQSSDPFLESKQYSGKLHSISSANGDIDLSNIRQELDARKKYLDVSDDIQERNDLIIPDIFKDDEGSPSTTLTITDVELVDTSGVHSLMGKIVLDEEKIISFRNDDILILDTVSAPFLVFSSNGTYFFLLLASRDVVEDILILIDEMLRRANLSVKELSLSHDAIETIADDLADELLDTTFEDYPRSSVKTKKIWGRGYRDDPEYVQEAQRGDIHGHMMSTTELADGKERVISVSDDALIRSYSTLGLDTYINMIQEHIIPHVTMQSGIGDF